MDPLFFSLKINSDEIDKLTYSIDKMMVYAETKETANSKRNLDKFVRKIHIFISEFKALQNQDGADVSSWKAFKKCYVRLLKLDSFLNKTPKSTAKETAEWALRAQEEVKVALEQLQSIEPQIFFAIDAELKEVADSRLLKITTCLDPFISENSHTYLESNFHEQLTSCCTLILKYFLHPHLICKGDLYTQASHALSYFIDEQPKSSKIALAKYLALCLKVCKYQTQIPNLRNLYDDLEVLLSEAPSYIVPYLKIKQAELLQIHLIYKEDDDFCITKQRQILISLILDNKIEDVELKVKAHYLLAQSFMKAKAGPRNYVMAKKYLQYVAAHGANTFYVPCAQYYLGFLHIFGLGKNIDIDMQAGLEYLEAGLQSNLLPENLAIKARRLKAFVGPLGKKIWSYEIKSQQLLEVREKVLEALNIYLGNDTGQMVKFFCDEILNKGLAHIYSYPAEENSSLEEIFLKVLHMEKFTSSEESIKAFYQKELLCIGEHFDEILIQQYTEAKDICTKWPVNYDSFPQELRDDLNKLTDEKFSHQLKNLNSNVSWSLANEIDWFDEDKKPYLQRLEKGRKYNWEIKIPTSNLWHDFIHHLLRSISEKQLSMKGILNFSGMLDKFANKIHKIHKNSSKKTKRQQEMLVRLVNYRKIALSNIERFDLFPSSTMQRLSNDYELLREIIPRKYQADFIFEIGCLYFNRHRSRLDRSNLLSEDLIAGVYNFQKALHATEDEEKKIKILEKMASIIDLNEVSVKKIIMELQSAYCIKIAKAFEKDTAWVGSVALKFLSVLIEYLSFTGEEKKANDFYNFISQHMPNSFLNAIDTKIHCDCCTNPTVSQTKLLHHGKELDAFFLSLLPSAPAFLPCEKVLYKKSAHTSSVGSSNANWQAWEDSSPTLSARQEAKLIALEKEKRQDKKALLKSQKPSLALAAAQLEPPSPTFELPTYVYISGKGIDTFQMIFTPQDVSWEARSCTSFDACDFRIDLKIKREDVINLIVELGGVHHPKEGKGSHTKCTLASRQHRDRFTLKGEKITLADFAMLEKTSQQSSAKSDIVTLTNTLYLKPYQVRQICSKLISLGFTPQTVKKK